MANIHFVLQGKGGVGKSLVTYFLAQFYKDQGAEILCLDTDPVNRSFASYEELNVQLIDLLIDGRVNEQAFDHFVEMLLDVSKDTNIIIDNGASTFLPLCAYLKENDILAF